MAKETMVLGLDIGPNSLGWAIVAYKTEAKGLESEPAGLIDAGVRIFPEGVDRTPQGSEQSRNAARREARSARRVHQRRNRRLGTLKAALQKSGLLPEDGEDFSKLMLEDPYRLRAAGLEEKLPLHGFGRAVYHLAQRRGFKSNRKSEKKSEDGDIAKGITALSKKIEDSGAKTLGEFLSRMKASGGAIRFRRIESSIPNRAMYEKEFSMLWDSQASYYPDVLGEALRREIHNAIFFQRPFDIRERWGKDLKRLPPGANARRAPELGKCEYEKNERRSPRAAWYAQRFRLLQEINNLGLIDTITGEETGLASEMRQKLIGELGKKKDMTFDRMRKLLGLEETTRFNLEEGKRTKLKGNSTELNLRQAFGKSYENLSDVARDEIIRTLIEEENEEELKHRAVEEWGLDEKGAERLARTTLEGGYLHLSVKALKKLLPHLEEGKTYMDAVEAAGYLRRDQLSVEASGRLSVKDMPGLTNPLVKAALYQVRRVINAIVAEYGAPSKIRVEIVRDLKNTGERRRQIIKEQRENERRNDNAKERLRGDFGMADPASEDVLRYKLWEECGRQCPYTGRAIPQDALFSADIEIEHIIPYSRSFDNSYMNKTLSYTGENRLKLDRTPFEFYGHDETRWNEILKRASRLPEKKRNRFYMKDVPDGFTSRQLNDTAYIATEVRSLLEKVVGKNNVRITKGQATAILRRLWGLNTALSGSGEKTRKDHRHHAVDAVVVALTSDGMLKRLSKAYAGGKKHTSLQDPWQGFRDDVKKRIDDIIVSFRVRRKVSGALHEETNYGILQKKDAKGQPLYAIRKALPALTRNEINLIADERVREIVKEHLKKHGADPNDGSEKDAAWKQALAPENAPCLPNKNGPPVPIKRVRLHKAASNMKHLNRHKTDEKPYRAVESGSNHHIVIFEYTAGKKNGRWDGEVVSMFDAAQRLKNNERVISRDLGDGRKFIMSLSINELVRIVTGDRALFYRVQKINMDKVITFRLHTAATIDSKEERLFKNPGSLKSVEAVKVFTDPIGRIREAHD